MQEYNATVAEALRKGLREDPAQRLFSDRLYGASGVLVRPAGLEGYIPVSDPFEGGETVSWPFPQLLRGERVTLLARETTVALVDETMSPFDVANLSLLNPTTGGAATVASGGGQWHFADGMRSWFLTNGPTVVYRLGLDDVEGQAAKTYTKASPFGTCVYGAGRFVLGNLTSSFWSTLSSLFVTWQAELPTGVAIPYAEMGGNWVAWGSIGGGDLPMWLLYPTGYTYDMAANAARFLQRMRENSLGWMPLGFQGDVLSLQKLGDVVVAFGEDGVEALVPVSGNQLSEMSPTFGRRTLLYRVGAAGRGAVGGHKGILLMVGTDGGLWQFGADLSVKDLGYAEHISPLLGSPITVAYDEGLGWFHIGGHDGSNERAFVLTPQGLSEVPERLTSGYLFEGGMVAVPDVFGTTVAEVVTEPTDFSLRQLKKVGWIRLGIETTEAVTVALDFRFQKGGTWTRTTFKSVNREGTVYMSQSGLEFRVVVRVASYVGLKIDYIEIGYQSDDRRYLRGANADKTGSRTGQ